MAKIYNIGVGGYNSYLIIDRINVIIDTVPIRYLLEFRENIEQYVDISEIKYIMFTRTTPDATGCAKVLISENPDMSVFATVAGLKNLKEITNCEFSEELIKNEQVINLGEDKLKFLITPNLSWPDTAIFYIEKEMALFSGNLFCNSPEAKYFQKTFLNNALNIVKNLAISDIFPGYASASDFCLYDEFLKEEDTDDVALIFSSFSGQTGVMAKAIEDELLKLGKKVLTFNADKMLAEEIVRRSEKCKAFIFGTPTINHNAAISVLNVICNLNPLNNQGKKAFVFGSYGWSGEGTNIVFSLLKNLKTDVYKRPFKSIFNPSEENILELKKEIRTFAEEI